MSNLKLPAEWESHEATWIAWPNNKSDWPEKFSTIPFVYAEIVKYISHGEKVSILVQSKEHKLKAEKVLKDSDVSSSNIEFFIKKTDRSWLRDSGPMFVKEEKKISIVDFKFNAWAKYDEYKLDDKIPYFISKKLNLKRIIVEQNGKQVVLEGGAFDTNGKGTLITTQECLLDEKVQTRNPGFTKQDYFDIFKKHFGINNVIWLGKGIAGDDTHGHIDDICRFVNEDTVVLVQEENTSDENYTLLKENKERLQNIYLPNGSKLIVIDLPMPSPVIFKGQRLPASYANFYISNCAVLVPTFNDPNDRIALGILSEIFKDRKVIGIHSTDLVLGLGTIHCLTKEQPTIALLE
ncbi:MAG: agmatine deiminase family protein [Ignavibacteria bacterium]|nr:agmatine deiminase family protein [Ignavibacteria bacterium]MBT8383204.1 agmatine deiminase family protein [Ignavibacteria bacterium]MBT8392127.1 agmatine deiminase family protein [Ignavibacteria bacterium]NNL22801.1 agmatine deiminase family protein [Ignavibacteriaceae bacterium]